MPRSPVHCPGSKFPGPPHSADRDTFQCVPLCTLQGGATGSRACCGRRGASVCHLQGCMMPCMIANKGDPRRDFFNSAACSSADVSTAVDAPSTPAAVELCLEPPCSQRALPSCGCWAQGEAAAAAARAACCECRVSFCSSSMDKGFVAHHRIRQCRSRRCGRHASVQCL